jgi:hypothetical protein
LQFLFFIQEVAMSAIAPSSRAGLVCLGLLTTATLASASDDTVLRLFNADGGNSG